MSNAKAIKAYNNLKIKAMIFDMDIDIETWSLVPKRRNETPPWIEKWVDKRNSADLDEQFDMDRE